MANSESSVKKQESNMQSSRDKKSPRPPFLRSFTSRVSREENFLMDKSCDELERELSVSHLNKNKIVEGKYFFSII